MTRVTRVVKVKKGALDGLSAERVMIQALIPKKIKKAFDIKTTQEGVSMTSALIKLINTYLSK